MECGLLLNVVVAQGTAILKLFTGEDKTLLIRRNSFFVLDLGLDIVDGIARFHLKGDGLAGDWVESILVDVGRTCGEVAAFGVHLRVFTKICMVSDDR